MKNITTGADKLVQLIAEKKKISLSDAADILGMDKDVLQEWAEFLEQEQLISMDYKFSKVWLEEKHITQKDVAKVAKEIISEKEAFERKIDAVVHSIKNDTSGFEMVKAEFEKIHERIKKEIENVKAESEELRRYEELKKNIDKEIEEQKKHFQEDIKKFHEEIDEDGKEISKVWSKLEVEKHRLLNLAKTMDNLEQKRQIIMKTLAKGINDMKEFQVETERKKREFVDVSKSIEKTVKLSIDTQKNLDKTKEEKIVKLKSTLDVVANEINKAQDELLKHAKEKTANIQERKDFGTKIYSSFKGSSLEKIKTQELIDSIEKEREELLVGLEKLKKKVHEFAVTKKRATTKNDLKEIEKAISEFEKRKNKMKGKIDSLVDNLKK